MLELLRQLDENLLLAINGWNSSLADGAMAIVSDRLTWVPLYLFCAWLLVHRFGLKNGILLTLAVIAAVGAADYVSHDWIKATVCRMRPSNPLNPLSESLHLVDGHRGGRFSFPSNHAANSSTLATAIVILLRRRWIMSMMGIWVLLNCYSRLYMGVHYPSDMLGGIALGILIGLATAFVSKRYILSSAGHPL